MRAVDDVLASKKSMLAPYTRLQVLAEHCSAAEQNELAPGIVATLGDADPKARDAALAAFRKLESASQEAQAAALVALLEGEGCAGASQIGAAIATLHTVPAALTVDRIVALLGHGDGGVRGLALAAFRKLGPAAREAHAAALLAVAEADVGGTQREPVTALRLLDAVPDQLAQRRETQLQKCLPLFSDDQASPPLHYKVPRDHSMRKASIPVTGASRWHHAGDRLARTPRAARGRARGRSGRTHQEALHRACWLGGRLAQGP